MTTSTQKETPTMTQVTNTLTIPALAPEVAPGGSRLHVENATIGYDKRVISEGLSVSIPDESFTVIVGPNACGKSTLLRGLSRLLKPSEGRVILDGLDITSFKAKEVARRLGLLPQTSIAPDGITVADLVARGRHPYQKLIRQWTEADEQAVLEAMDATAVTDLSGRLVDELSGGQRQRVWVALALAQQTDILLLDEPTTYLDVAHQVEVLDLLTDLNKNSGITIAMVLHDLNLAARYCDQIVMIADGGVEAMGVPSEIFTEERVEKVFGLKSQIIPDPVSGTPLVLPIGRHRVLSA